MASELDEIKKRYERRKETAKISGSAMAVQFRENMVREREDIYKSVLSQKFDSLKNIKLIEVGAGGGSNLRFFNSAGIPWNNMFANELLDDRVEELKKQCPELTVYPGNALDLPFTEEFDLVFQSTVFSSILDPAFRRQLAKKMMEMTKPGGIILWYDFIYDNPRNADVTGITRREIRTLFEEASAIRFTKATLAPPLGRRIGKWYGLVNGIFPFLRTHVVAVIRK